VPLSANLKQEIASARTDPRRMLFAGMPNLEEESLLLEIGGDLSQLDQIERDGHIAGILNKRRLNVTRHEWEVKAASDDAKDQMAADIVRANFLRLNLDEAAEHLLDAVWKGFSGVEPLWDVDANLNRIVVTELRPRPQDRLMFKLPDGEATAKTIHHLGYELRVRTHTAPFDGIPVPARKFLIHSRGSKIGNPMGRPILGAVLWWLSNFKREVIKFWLIHLDKFSSPTPKGTYPMGNTQLKQQVLDAMDSIGQSGFAVVPDGVNLDLLDTTSRTGDPFEKFIEWANREASKAILGETLSTQEGVSGGSRAATEAHMESSSVHLAKRDADLITPVFNELACWITELNVPGATPPTFWRLFPELEAKSNLNQVAARDKLITDFSGKKLSEEYITSTYGVEFQKEEKPDDREDSNNNTAEAAPLIGTLGIGGSQALMTFLGQYQELGMSTDNAIAIMQGVFGIAKAIALPMLPKKTAQSGKAETDQAPDIGAMVKTSAEKQEATDEDEASDDEFSETTIEYSIGWWDGNVSFNEGKYAHISFVPPASVRAAAARGLELRKRQPASKKGGLDVKQAAAEGIGSGVQRAVNLKNGAKLSPSTVRRMKAYFDRHQGDKSGEGWGSSTNPSKGYQAWLLWGGDAGYSWARKVCGQMDAADAKNHAELTADFAKKGRKAATGKVKNCTKGYSCGYSCIPKSRKCGGALPDQGKDYADYLTKQIKAKKKLLPHHQADADAMGLTKKKKSTKGSGSSGRASGGNSGSSASSTPQKTTKPTSKTKVNQTELNVKRKDLVDRFGQKAVTDAENNVKRILDDSDVFIRMGSTATLEKVLGDRFRTSAELKITDHKIPNLQDKSYQTARNRVEAKSLGYSDSTKPEDRPIYGYLAGKDLDGNSHRDVANAYGSIAIKLKSKVKDRTTFTGGDSFKSGIASDVKNDGTLPPPSAASLVASTRHGYDKDKLPAGYPGYFADKSADGGQLRAAANARNIDDLAPALAITGNSYVEAQIHGKVRPSDIAEIHFKPNGVVDRPTAAIAKFAQDNNVDLYVRGNKLSSQELNDLANPNRRTRIQDLNDALGKEDFTEVAKISREIESTTINLKLAPGERDINLKAMYEMAGYDNLPKIGTSQDVTNAWQSGGTLMVRGVQADTTPGGDRLSYLKQFQSGDYFVGNGMYGNGTYVGHAGNIVSGKFQGYTAATKAADAKRAFNDVAKHNYIGSQTVNFRMALDSSAKIGVQSQVLSERNATLRSLDSWEQSEQSRIKTDYPVPAADRKKYQADRKQKDADRKVYDSALAKAANDNASLAKAKPKETGTRNIKNGLGTEISLSATGANNIKVDFKVRSEQNGYLTNRRDHLYLDQDGVWKRAMGKADAIAKGQKAAIAMRNRNDALQASGFASVPERLPAKMPDLSVQAKQRLQDLDADVTRIKSQMGLDDRDSGGLGRYAVARGYDAVALNQSYEANTFMNLLNRSKVIIDRDPLTYQQGQKTGAL
jgi:hypothetical protein